MADVALGFLAKMKQQLDDAQAVTERATEVKKYIDLFEVTMAMIPKRNTKGDVSKPKEKKEEGKKEKGDDLSDGEMTPSTVDLSEDEEVSDPDWLMRLEAYLPPSAVDHFRIFNKVQDKIVKEHAKICESGDLMTTLTNEGQYLMSCFQSKIEPPRIKEERPALSSGAMLLEMKGRDDITDLEISFMGIACLVQSGFDEIEDAVSVVLDIAANPVNFTWVLMPWKFQEQIDRGSALDDHLTKIDKFINLLQAAISVASYAVSLEQLDNTMNAANAIEESSFRRFWQRRIGTTLSRIPTELFADTIMNMKQRELIKHHRDTLKYWTEEIEDSPDTPDILYKRFMFSKFILPAGTDTISVFNINNLNKNNAGGQTKTIDTLFDELKDLELSFTRKIRFEILTYDKDSEEKKLKINKALKFTGVYKVKPFQRLYLSCTAPVFKTEVSSFDCFALLKYDDELEGLEGPDITLEEVRKYRLYIRPGVADPIHTPEPVNGIIPPYNKFTVSLPKLNPRPPGFTSSDNFANVYKNVSQLDSHTAEQLQKHWLHYKYSKKLKWAYIHQYQRMLYCPVLYQPGSYTVRYCLDSLELGEQTSREHIKSLALKSTKCYYYNREIPLPGSSTLTHLAALSSPDHAQDFGSEELQKRFIRIYLSYLKEVEWKEAKWKNDAGQIEKLISLREMVSMDETSTQKSDHLRFDGISIFSYTTGEEAKKATIVINRNTYDSVDEIIETIRALICDAYPQDPEDGSSSTADASSASTELKNGHASGEETASDAAKRVMDAAWAYLESMKRIHDGRQNMTLEELKADYAKYEPSDDNAPDPDPKAKDGAAPAAAEKAKPVTEAAKPVEVVPVEAVPIETVPAEKSAEFEKANDASIVTNATPRTPTSAGGAHVKFEPMKEEAPSKPPALPAPAPSSGGAPVDPSKVLSADYMRFQKIQIDLLKFLYFFLVRDLINDVCWAHTKQLSTSTLAQGKKLLESQRSEKLQQWKAKKAALEALNSFESDILLPDVLEPSCQLKGVDFKKGNLIEISKAKSYRDFKRCFVGPKNQEDYRNFMLDVIDLEIREAFNFRKYTRVIDLYEFRCDLADKVAAKQPGPKEMAKSKSTRAGGKGSQEMTDAMNAPDEVKREQLTREAISSLDGPANLKVLKLRSYVKILQKDIETNFASAAGSDRAKKLKRLDDCRYLVDMLKHIQVSAGYNIPSVYPFQILGNKKSNKKRCPLGLVVEVVKDFGLAWGDGAVGDEEALDIDTYLENNHVKYDKVYPYDVATELRVSIYNEKQTMKYLVLVASSEEKDEMYLRVRNLDDVDNDETVDETNDIEVVGTDFIRYASLDIKPLFDKLHEVPKYNAPAGTQAPPVDPTTPSDGRKFSLSSNGGPNAAAASSNALASANPASPNPPVPLIQESDTMSLFRHLKTLRRVETALEVKLSVIEKVQYDLDELKSWNGRLRISIRNATHLQYSVITKIRESCEKRPNKSPEFKNLWEKTLAKLTRPENVKLYTEKNNGNPVSYELILSQREMIKTVMLESLEDPHLDTYTEEFDSDMEAVIVLTKKVSEYKKLMRIQHCFLSYLGDYLKLKDSASRVIFTQPKHTKYLKDFSDATARYHYVLKKFENINIPDFVLFPKEMFSKDNDSSKPGGGAAADSKTDSKAGGDADAKAVKEPPKRARGVAALFDFLEEKLAAISGDFQDFWKEMAMIEANESNADFFKEIGSDDALKKRFGGMKYDADGVKQFEDGKDMDDDRDGAKDGDGETEDFVDLGRGAEETASKDGNESVSDDKSSLVGGSSEAISDTASTLGLDAADKAEDSEEGQYTACLNKIKAFISLIINPDKFTPPNAPPVPPPSDAAAAAAAAPAAPSLPLFARKYAQFSEKYNELYENDMLDFPLGEFYDELKMVLSLVDIFLAEISEKLYKKTTFEIRLLNSNKVLACDKVLTVIFVENDVVDDESVQEEEDAEDDVDQERERADFGYLEEEQDADDSDNLLGDGPAKKDEDD